MWLLADRLAEEGQHFTTFITPYRRFRYCRGPMSFSATGDMFCLRGDMTLQGIPNCVKVVDDILLHDECYIVHLQHVHAVLTRCRKHGITLNADKFTLVAPTVSFCCYVLSEECVAVDPRKVKAIAKFSTPANITHLRSFTGFVNHLAEFSPHISGAAQLLRPLMSFKRAFTWALTMMRHSIERKRLSQAHQYWQILTQPCPPSCKHTHLVSMALAMPF